LPSANANRLAKLIEADPAELLFVLSSLDLFFYRNESKICAIRCNGQRHRVSALIISARQCSHHNSADTFVRDFYALFWCIRHGETIPKCSLFSSDPAFSAANRHLGPVRDRMRSFEPKIRRLQTVCEFSQSCRFKICCWLCL